MLVRAPATSPRPLFGRGSGDLRGLPDEGGQLAGAGHGGHVGVLAASVGELVPLELDASLRPPGDLADARIPACLAAPQLIGDARWAPGVLGGLD
jgi:hypothetical protein